MAAKWQSGWVFRREVTMGALVQLVVLLAGVLAGWSNLQRELAAIQQELRQLVVTSGSLQKNLEDLSRQNLEQEYRLRMLEKTSPNSNLKSKI